MVNCEVSMSSKRELECLSTLFEKSLCEEEFTDFLVDNKIMKRETINLNDRSMDRLKTIYQHLKDAVKSEKILLLDFKWQLLPLHQIDIHIITERGERHFLYGY